MEGALILDGSGATAEELQRMAAELVGDTETSRTLRRGLARVFSSLEVSLLALGGPAVTVLG